MSFTAEPIIGEWYHDNESDSDFEIVDFDEYEGVITIRRKDADEGDNEEILFDDWDEMLLEPADSPLRDRGLEDDFSAGGDVESKEDLEEGFEFDEE